MDVFFTHHEGALLARLLIAYLIAAFFMSSQKGIEDKKNRMRKSNSFWLHGVYTSLVFALLMWHQFNWPAFAIIAVSHFLIDYACLFLTKSITEKRWMHRDLWLFVINQLLRILIIIIAWLITINGFDKAKSMQRELFLNYPLLLRVSGYLIVIGPITQLIKLLTLKWANEVVDPNNSLKDAGRWIGVLERLIVITLVFVGQYTAIGFLATAKSILRLIDKPEPPLIGQVGQKAFSSRKHTEYVVIGTFLSFSAAILTGLAINWLLTL